MSPDTHLVLTFPAAPTLGKSGQIRIYDAADNRLVDTLELSIPPGPTSGVTGPPAPYTPTPYQYSDAHPTNADTTPGTPSDAAVPTPRNYQLTIIGGFSDGFHFYPVIVGWTPMVNAERSRSRREQIARSLSMRRGRSSE